MSCAFTIKQMKSFLVCSGIILSSAHMFSQQTPSIQASKAFENYFTGPAAGNDADNSKSEIAYEKLVASIGTLPPLEVTEVVSVIDRQIDSTAESQNSRAKGQAALLLWAISGRTDGPELLASQMGRLSSMLADSSHRFGAITVLILFNIGRQRPDVVIPILEPALKFMEVNPVTDVGPGVAAVLLQIAPTSDQVTNDVVQYMRRPDLTDYQLISTIIGINNSQIPDAVTAELVRVLDRPNDRIKIRALIGVAKSSPSARDAARERIQKMANDPRETPHVRRIAAAALEGRINEDPEKDK